MESAKMLCWKCREGIKCAFIYFSDRDAIRDRFFFGGGYGPDWQQFYQSYQDGCYICASVYVVLMRHYCSVKHSQDPPIDEISHLTIIEDLRHTNHFTLSTDGKLSVKSAWTSTKSHPVLTGFSPKRMHSDYWAKFHFVPLKEMVDDIRGPLIPWETSNTGDEGAWSVVQAWMSQCLLDHPECRPPKEQGQILPMRLIDLGPTDACEPKIVEPDASRAEPFVTLSHCWGGALAVKLTSKNLRAYQERLPLDDLPQTFKDAFVVARRLGSRFLWIDALCIVQDDKNEWREQSKSMADFYSNSMCTIAAQASRDSSQGLFRDRSNVSAAPSCVYIERPEQYKGTYAVYNDSSVDEYVDGPLFNRAWVFQERVFAKRMIAFGERCIFWECKAPDVGAKSENCPSGMNEHGFYFTKDNLPAVLESCVELDKTSVRSVQAGGEQRHLRYWWSRAVRYYCTFALTHETDRLVAISAIAKKCAEPLGSEYLAGLWKKWLMYDLCWVVSVPGKQSEAYVAPSWSWACRAQVLQNDYWADMTPSDEIWGSHKPLAMLVDYEMTPAGTDVTGQLVSAWLCVSGCPIAVTVMDVKEMVTSNVPVDCDPHEQHPSETNPLKLVWDVPGEMWNLDLTLQLLPLIGLSLPKPEDHLIKGIVLRPAIEHEEGFFQRVGMFQFLGGRKKLSIFVRHIAVRSIWRPDRHRPTNLGGLIDEEIWTASEKPQPLMLV